MASKKRSRTAGRAGARAKGKGNPSRKARPRKGAPSRLGARVRAVRRGVRDVGIENVKRGPILIGSTRRLTPTHAGFRALDSFLLAVQQGRHELYTFDLDIRWRGPDGRFEHENFPRNVIPQPRDVARRRKHGETNAAAFRRIVTTEIKRAIFRQVQDKKSIFGDTDKLRRRLRGKPQRSVEKAIRDFKSRRALTFRVTLRRVIP